jgi:hypothetical protein
MTLRPYSEGRSTNSREAFTVPPIVPGAIASKRGREKRRAAASRVRRSTACGCSAASWALRIATESTTRGAAPAAPAAAVGGAPRPAVACAATVGSFSPARWAGVRSSRSIVATATASANRFGACAPRPPANAGPPCGPPCGPPAPRRPGCGSSTTNLPAASAAVICVVVSPAVPPKITGAFMIGRGARSPGTATKSAFHASGFPFTVSRELDVNFRRWYGRIWK